MNNEQFKGKWNQLKGRLKEKWGKLTDNDIAQINGRREQLLGNLQTRYGWAKKQAEEELNRFEKSLENVKEKTTEKYDQEYFKKGHQNRNEDSSEDEDFPKRNVR